MLSPIRPQSAMASPQHTPKILASRSQYRACHICLPGETQRIPAVMVDDRLYSLFKVVKHRPKALELCARLAARGSETVITQTPKGDAIWTLEPDAYVAVKEQTPPAKPMLEMGLPSYRILESRNEYRACHVRVPDLDKPLAALMVDGRFYGLFKIVDTQPQALDIAARLGRKGNDAVITRVAQGYSVWVLELEARLAF